MIGLDGVQYPVTSAVERFLSSMNKAALSSLVLELASYSPEAMRWLQLRAAPGDIPVLRELVVAIDAAVGGLDLDYHDPFYDDGADDGVQVLDEVLDELERHLETGAHEVVRQALEHLLFRVGDLARDADNADVLLVSMERASELFGHAVRATPTRWDWHAGWSVSGWSTGGRRLVWTPSPTLSTSRPGRPTVGASRRWAAEGEGRIPIAAKLTACCWNSPTTTGMLTMPSPCCREPIALTTGGRQASACCLPAAGGRRLAGSRRRGRQR